MKAVLDCNVIVSGLIRPDGAPAQALNAFIEGRLEVILSPSILEEYRRILQSPKVRRYTSLSIDGLESFLTSFALAAFWVEDRTSANPIVLLDPSDDIYLLAAAEGRADYLVSGDNHLLAIKRYQDIPIVTPREFVRALG